MSEPKSEERKIKLKSEQLPESKLRHGQQPPGCLSR
ncbi:hypothetical protein SSE37_18652 [Sagittula stellata E-37]|uniref:Uncharacterized protein n=1 Tax=Sagittula stellata (strain ATCC 700073 / DSM 11524 / E-37) TaxID=388399 RepID=A3JX18_SAGS3|nr:hypothetical protein SSE37_18652 [Sagittula stellata E-37]